jgi:tetratricopeptide (TPR) repeat protein
VSGDRAARHRWVGGLLLLALSLSATGARADDTTTRARAAFERGRTLYAEGQYEAAAREFEAGFALAPRPLFLVNLGQAYRQLGNLEKARDSYRHFLSVAPLTDPQRPAVERIVTELEREIAEHPIPGPEPAKPAVAPTSSPTPAPVSTVQAPPAKKKPFILRHWWIIPVSVVAATGLAVGIYFAARPREASIDCSGASLGCLP